MILSEMLKKMGFAIMAVANLHIQNKYTVLMRIRTPAAIVFDDCFPPVAIQACPYSSRGSYRF